MTTKWQTIMEGALLLYNHNIMYAGTRQCCPERALEGGWPASNENGLDRDQRAERAEAAGPGASGNHLRYLSLGKHTRPVCFTQVAADPRVHPRADPPTTPMQPNSP